MLGKWDRPARARDGSGDCLESSGVRAIFVGQLSLRLRTACFSLVREGAENRLGIQERLVRGRGLMGKRSRLLFDKYIGIGE